MDQVLSVGRLDKYSTVVRGCMNWMLSSRSGELIWHSCVWHSRHLGVRQPCLKLNITITASSRSISRPFHRHLQRSRMDDDDDFGADADFLAALAATETIPAPKPRIQQPTPQVIPRPSPSAPSPNTTTPKVVQPTPQALPSRSSGSSILVSPRQKGNPILTSLRSLPWEYSDIPADYVLGNTTCALFLSLKYHRLHPEYIYNRIRQLAGKYLLRILLVMVDIENHDEPLRELSKTSLINNVTVILTWSAAEAARYLELYKSYEHANFSAIKGQEPKGYTERMVEFVTTPRGINKTDAVSLVSAFGTVRNAVNARPEEIASLGGWGERKVERWMKGVGEPFRITRAGKRRRVSREGEERPEAVPLSRMPLRETASLRKEISGRREEAPKENEKEKETEIPREPFQMWDPGADSDEEEVLLAIVEEEEKRKAAERRKEQVKKDEELGGGIAAALAKLRKD
jgi:DNA excision repair protein ERCC-1